MYHGVGPDRPDWIWNFLITDAGVFEGQLRLLRDEGWTTITLAELHSHMAEDTDLPDKPVVLTFDDGYLDNWVYAYPLLEKYGHRGVIWMSTDFVDPRAEPRPNLKDLWAGKAQAGDLEARGYLSWEEMARMTRSGHVEIQSHAMTHTWYFNGPDVIDFHRPTGVDDYVPPPWLAWNRFPEQKYASLVEDLEKKVDYGTPIYMHGKAMTTRRYLEDEALTRRLVDEVSSGGGQDYFKRADWRKRLSAVVEGYGPRKDRVETEAEYRRRIAGELAGSRKLIEDALGTEVRFLCWPGGDHDQMTQRLAHEAGYLATTTHFEHPRRRNIYGEDPREINRIGCGSPWIWHDGVSVRKTDPAALLASLEGFAAGTKPVWKLRRYKLKYLLQHYLAGRT
jgi:peptidoglycan/xylan/chitin deacetylase (PgdA/CDA1 family)